MLLEDIADIVAVQLGMPSVDPDNMIIEDLGAESADIVNIIATVEERFSVTIDEQDLLEIRTVKDLFESARSHEVSSPPSSHESSGSDDDT